MTTTRERAQILEGMAYDTGRIAQAAAAGEIDRGERPTWQMNALERAGDYARAGEWRESRRMAKQFEEGN